MSETICPHCGKDYAVNIEANDPTPSEWVIGHPGTGYPITCSTFDEAMDRWFEGFNVPVRYVDGKAESFTKAYQRVKEYFDKKKHGGKE